MKTDKQSSAKVFQKTSKGLAMKVEELIKNLEHHTGKIFKNFIFVSDEKIWHNCCKFFPQKFQQRNIKFLLISNPKADQKTLQKVLRLTKNHDLIIALGSGTISDLCKLTSAQNDIPYIIFPSAASMNGYLSNNASITILGHKKTLKATLPLAVFCDLKILRSAPVRLTKAGIGDMMCFYSCWFDWFLSHKILATEFDQKPFDLLKKKMNFFVRNFHNFSIKDEKFLRMLIKILLLSGEGMTIAKGSYPASQSEHLIAHCLAMKYPKKLDKFLHGELIAITTLTASKMQKRILQNDVDFLLEILTKNIRSNYLKDKNLSKFFGKKIADQCREELKSKLRTIGDINEIEISLKKNWREIRKNLRKIYLEQSCLKEIFCHFKIKTSPKFLGLSSLEYQDCVSYAALIRNRFTCLDL